MNASIHTNPPLLVLVLCLSLLSGPAPASPLSSLTNKVTAAMSDLPRNQKLPLFDPHRKSFTCVYQDQHVPPVDPQAELWYQQALTLDDPDIYPQKRNWPQIYTLYKQAAERNHWKAMLNLASLILSDKPVPEHDPEQAIRWVEKAMQLGVPDAYDRMGIYHQNGLIKGGDATSAYAFFQKAADMGSPSAMTFLGDKLGGTYDSPDGEFWGNRSIAIKMLECAFAQGDGDAASELGLLYSSGYSAEAKEKALKIFHEGVKLGSAKCANRLSSEFRGIDLTSGTNLVGHIDKARAERYSTIARGLEWYEGRLKLPNLDKVLPLPPADLPKWDGNKKTLIDAAKAVVPPLPARPAPTAASQRQGRAHIPDGYTVASQSESPFSVAGDQRAPQSGYYLSSISSSSNAIPEAIASHDSRVVPQRYEAGEYFAAPDFQWLSPRNVLWHYVGEARPLPPPPSVYLNRMIQAGLIRARAPAARLPLCDGLAKCPQTGIWESRVGGNHPLATLYNRWDQQAFVVQGQPFPDPQARFLDIAAHEVRWFYRGNPNVDTNIPGVQDIAL